MNQFLVLSNQDRASYGLTQIAGLNATLNAAAAAGIASDSDPSGPAVVDGNHFMAWTANWAAGWSSPLYTYYEWMYDDGYGSSNIDCTSAAAAGCWGHRKDTLYNFGNAQVLMGAAAGTSPRYNAAAFTELYESFPIGAPVSFVAAPAGGSPTSCLGSSTGTASAASMLTGTVPVGTATSRRENDMLAIDANGGLWYYQNSSATTPYAVRTPAGADGLLSYISVATGDVNGDGRADLIAISPTGSLWYYLGNGTSTPYSGGAVEIGASGWAAFNWIGLGDVNGDGRADLLATSTDGRLWYYQNNGTSTPFTTGIVIAAAGWQSATTTSLTVGDVNGDGHADLVASTSDGRLLLFQNSGSSSSPFGSPRVIGSSGWQNFNRVALADVDGDGRADLVTTTADGRLWLYPNNATATPFSTATVIGSGGWNNYPTLLLGNVHGTGTADLVATRPDGSLWVYQNNGTSTPYSGLANVGTGGWQNFTKIALGDLRGNGLQDLIATSTDGRLWYYPNTNSCSPYNMPFIIGTGGWQNFTKIALADVNGDGLGDLIATSTDGRLWYYQNNGTGTPYITPTIIGTGGWQNFSTITLGDVNGDGRADIIATSAAGQLWYYQNNGTATPYSTPTIIGTGGWQNFATITLADVNGDGHADIIATSYAGQLWYYQNNGTANPYTTPAVIGPWGWLAYNRLY